MPRINRDDIDKFHDYSLHVPSRTIYMGSEENSLEFGESGTDSSMAERIIKNLHLLDSLNKEPITIIMNNYGGDVNHGLAIYDCIESCKSHITIKVFGGCMSMGSIIFQAADERIMSKNASQMIHYGRLALDKEQLTVYKIVEEMKRIDSWMEKMYLEKIKEKHVKFTLSRLKKLLNNDTFFTAEESVSLGLCDKVYGDEE